MNPTYGNLTPVQGTEPPRGPTFRFVELDVHYDGSRSGDARFRVGHDDPGAEVYYGGGNPAGRDGG